jgi:hypothetical protein
MGLFTNEQDGRVFLLHDADTSFRFPLGPDVWKELEAQIKAKTLDGPAHADSGVGFVQPDPIYYGDGVNDYIAVTFEGGSVVFRDGNDPTGRANQVSSREWAAYVARVRGEETEQDKGPLRGDKKDPSEDGFQAGVDGDMTAREIAVQKTGVNDRDTDFPASGGEGAPGVAERRAETTAKTSGSSSSTRSSSTRGGSSYK